jgi:hypothetical protein
MRALFYSMLGILVVAVVVVGAVWLVPWPESSTVAERVTAEGSEDRPASESSDAVPPATGAPSPRTAPPPVTLPAPPVPAPDRPHADAPRGAGRGATTPSGPAAAPEGSSSQPGSTHPNPGTPEQPGGQEPVLPDGVTWDEQARSFAVASQRIELEVDYSAGVNIAGLSVDGTVVLDAPAPATRITLPGNVIVTSAQALDVEIDPTATGMEMAFRLPIAGGDVVETWHLGVDGDAIAWDVEREVDLTAPMPLAIESAALAFVDDAWQNVRRPADGGNIPVGGPQLVEAAATFTAIDALGRNGILLESAPNHAVFDADHLVFLTPERPTGLEVTVDSTSTVTSLIAREGSTGSSAELRAGWRFTAGAVAYANGNPAGYDSRFSEDADEQLLAAATYSDGDVEGGSIRLAAVERAPFYAGADLAGFDNAALSALINDFGRTIVQGADIGASSERSFRAGEAPAFTSPWNVWALELIQDPGAFASMRSQIADIVAEPKRDPANPNTRVGGELGGLQDENGRIWCCRPFSSVNTVQPTYATTDSVFNLVFATATLYNLDPDAAWLEGIADDIRLALQYAEDELLIEAGPTAGLFANSQCADPQSVTGCFIDWSEWNDQYDIGQVSAYHNVFAYAALAEWADLERAVLSDGPAADHYESLAAGIETAYNRTSGAGGFWSSATDAYAYTRDASGALAKDCSHLFTNGYPLMFGLVDSPARELTVAFSMREQYDRLATEGHVYDHGAQGGSDYRWRIHGSNPVSCGSGETVEGGYPRMYFPFFEDGGGHLLNEQPAAQIALTTGDRSNMVDHARTVVDRYDLDHFMGWSNIQPDTLLPRRDIWQEPFMVNNVLGVWSLYHDVLGLQPRHDRLDVLPAIDASLVDSVIDYRLRGDEPVRVEYLGTESYAITADVSVPVRVGWQRLPGEQLVLTVDGVDTAVVADAEGEVWVDATGTGRSVYTLSGESGILSDDDAFEFSSEWWSAPGDEFAGGSLRGTSSAGATATLRFTGTGAAALASVGGDKGLATVTVDGVEISVGDWYADTGVHLRRPVVVTGLEHGEHELVITVRGEHSAASVGDQITIDGAVVFGGDLTPPDPDAPSETAVHPSNLTYTGGWWGVADPAFLLGELRGTSETGATVSYSFTGTGFTISGSTGGDKGQARVEIDGVEVAVADWYSTSPGHRVPVYAVDGLAPGSHTVTVTVLGTAAAGSTGTQVNLDAILTRTGS